MSVRVALVGTMVVMLMVGCGVALDHRGPETTEQQVQDGAIVVAGGGKDRPIRVSSGVMAGLIQHRVLPVYPEEARTAKVSGAVVMAATIDDHGRIVELSVLSGPEMLRDACLKAVKQWTYKPYLLNGEPVFVKTQITINLDFGG